MVDRSQIQDGMEIVGRDGGHVGHVQDVESGRIIVGGGRAADGSDRRSIALSHVDRVEGGRVHLLDSARVETGSFADRLAEATGDPDPHHPRAPRGRGWLLWTIGALVLILSMLFVYMRTLDREREELAAPPQIEPGPVSAVGTGGPQLVRLSNGRQLQLDPLGVELQVHNFLADTQLPAPRSFPFERLNFDTGSAAIRPADRSTISNLGQILAAHPNARIRIVGFADTRGAAPTNANLGQQRAEAVVAALAAAGVSRDRLEAMSGGEGSPAAPNTTAQGQAENRRTELVVLSK